MDVFGAENMQERGNFVSLMFFVMGIGLLVVYGVLGWSTNIIAQVSGLLKVASRPSILMFLFRRHSATNFDEKCSARCYVRIFASSIGPKIPSVL